MSETTKREDLIIRWLESRPMSDEVRNWDRQDAENIAGAIRDGEHLEWAERFEGSEAIEDEIQALRGLIGELVKALEASPLPEHDSLVDGWYCDGDLYRAWYYGHPSDVRTGDVSRASALARAKAATGGGG